MRVAIAGISGFLGNAIARALDDATGDLETWADALVWAAGTHDVSTPASRAVHADDVVATMARIRPRRVIYLSTAEVYGDVAVPVDETTPRQKSTAYADIKLDGEYAVRAASIAFRSTAIALRLGVVYGTGQRPSMLIPQVVRALRERQPIALTSGEQTCDFIHVDDVVRAVVAALHVTLPPPAINIGTGRETRVEDVCLSLARLTCCDPGLLRFGERPPRHGEPRRSALAIGLARHVLDWQPQVALADGLARLLQ